MGGKIILITSILARSLVVAEISKSARKSSKTLPKTLPQSPKMLPKLLKKLRSPIPLKWYK